LNRNRNAEILLKVESNFGFRFTFESKFRPKPKDGMIPKPKCLPKPKFWPKSKFRYRNQKFPITNQEKGLVGRRMQPVERPFGLLFNQLL
jgi:hypothetical protein